MKRCGLFALSLLVLFSHSQLAPAQAQGEGDPVAWMTSRLLTGKDILDYELAVNKFVVFSDPRVLPTLIEMTEGTKTVPRAEAAGVLWHYNTNEVRENLLQLAKDRRIEVQVEAAKSLCLMGYPDSLPVITKALGEKNAKVRARALRALATIKGGQAKAAIETLRSSNALADRIWVAYALYTLKVEPKKQLAFLKKIALSLPPSARLPNKRDPTDADLKHAATLGTTNLAPRIDACQALSKIGTGQALEILVLATGDLAAAGHAWGPHKLLPRHGDQAAAALAVGLTNHQVLVRLGSAVTAQRLDPRTEQTRNTLAAALEKSICDESQLVRLAALQAIAHLGLDSQAPVLTNVLSHPDPKTRGEAARALGALGTQDSIIPLIERLKVEENRSAQASMYQAISRLRPSQAVEPLFEHLKLLYKESRQNARVVDEIPLCIEALAAGGDATADKALELLPKLKGDRRRLMTEVLARSGSERGIDFFIDQLRESPPDPDSPAVRFFDSLESRFTKRLEDLIESETARWIRIILARALFRNGKPEYQRGIIWGLGSEEPYLRKLSAALAVDLQIADSVEPLTKLLRDEPDTATYATRALLASGSPRAIEGLLAGLRGDILRQRWPVPVKPFWEGRQSASHPFAKEVDNDRVWVVFADDRIGRRMDLFVTWSVDGRSWHQPIFTGLTSFADPEGNIPPPTFSLKVRSRDITIALTRTFARLANYKNPHFKTIQRIHRFKFQDLFQDRDDDGSPDLEEHALGTNPLNRDSDGDGTPDGKDKNPLAKPANFNRDEEVIKVLAFGYAFLVKKFIPKNTRLLVVSSPPDQPPAPELPTFQGLVLHLKPEQIRSLWKTTGGGFPQVEFGPTQMKGGGQAVQSIQVVKGINDEERVKVTLLKQEGQWIVSDYQW